MIKLILIAILLFQVPPPIDWPSLPSPTPYRTPTPNATQTAVATAHIPANDMLNQLSTSESQVQALPTTIAASGSQIYYEGRPVLPDENGAQLWGFWKWFTSTNGYALFGPLQPILIHLGVLAVLALIGLLIYFLQLIIGIIIKFVLWVADWIGKLIPG